MIEFTLPGKPLPQKRARHVQRGKFVRVYSPSKKDQDDKRTLLRSIWLDKPIDGPVEISIVFYMPIPQSWSKCRQREIAGQPHTVKSDIDNLLKFYADVMNGIVYTDDRQIYKITAVKKYDENPRTVTKVIWQESNQDSDSESGQP